MLDAVLRKVIDPPLARIAKAMVRTGVRANHVTWAGFVVGMAVIPALAMGQFWLAALAIILNRLADGLDGAIARETRVTDVGGFLDIVLDFLFYSAVPFGLALANPEQNALAAAFLIYSFIGTGSSFLAYSTMAAKRGKITEHRGRKSLYYLGGLTEGTETFAVLLAMCVFPAAFVWLAVGFGALCWLTTATRIVSGLTDFVDP